MKGNKSASHMDNKYQTFADLLYASYSGLQTLAFDVGEKSQTLSGLAGKIEHRGSKKTGGYYAI